ncbi:MAG: hypothetical protein SGJ19_02505 [Planctomycetia bacterium]|nr:hypothetical protein [Planctomycetia bacterium]
MTDIPDDIRRFVHESFDSVVKLEILLLLRSTPGRAFTSDDVAGALQASRDMMHTPLRELAGRGLLRPDDANPSAYCYAPVDETLQAKVDAVAELYRVRRAAMVSLIYSQPVDRMQSFADAFKLRKEQ